MKIIHLWDPINCKHAIKACLLDMRHSYINFRENNGGGISVLHIISNDENIQVFDRHLFFEINIVEKTNDI